MWGSGLGIFEGSGVISRAIPNLQPTHHITRSKLEHGLRMRSAGISRVSTLNPKPKTLLQKGHEGDFLNSNELDSAHRVLQLQLRLGI